MNVNRIVCKEVLLGRNKKCQECCISLQGNTVSVATASSKNDNLPSHKLLVDVLSKTFLPVGYPHSVRKEYLTYQMWDSIQGMSSYLRSVLTTRSVLAGAGVGSASTTALAAAFTWILRDGIGMIGSLVFAYHFSDTFEVNIKEWRYLADILNNIGLSLDLFSSHFPRFYLHITSVSTLCKACCGLIAGTTKARISAHFARPGLLADVTAKESTQETAVALCGLLFGMLLAQLIGNDDVSVWATFVVLLALHQYSNYHLVKVLVLTNINPQRGLLIVQHSAPLFDAQRKALSTTKAVNKSADISVPMPPPSEISRRESFVRPIYLSYFGPNVGGSIHSIIQSIQFVATNRSSQIVSGDIVRTSTSSDGTSICSLNVCDLFARLCEAWASEEFIVGVDAYGRVVVALQEGIRPAALMKASLVGSYVHHLLRVPPTLRAASQSARYRYLIEVYQFLTSRLAAEALRWYAALDRQPLPPASSEAQSDVTPESKAEHVAVEDEDDYWDMADTSALSVHGYRYVPFAADKED